MGQFRYGNSTFEGGDTYEGAASSALTGTATLSGDGSLTVKAAGKVFGASERMTINFADLDSSTLNIVAGESGQPLSTHYLDQWSAWYGGKTFALPFSEKNVNAAAVHRLTLRP